MAEVEIITRAFNRLEYTSMCVRSIDEKAGFKNYSHIIINQSSTDGTKQWLDSLLKEGYYKLKVKHNEENSGDAGGMKDGFDMIGDDCKYIMQFDNDCQAITKDFLKKMYIIMEYDPTIAALMMKRENVINVIRPTLLKQQYNHLLGIVDKATCCVMFRRKLIEELGIWKKEQEIGWCQSVTKELRKKYQIIKCMDIRVEHIDGIKQNEKYPLYFGGKEGNVIHSNYTRVKY